MAASARHETTTARLSLKLLVGFGGQKPWRLGSKPLTTLFRIGCPSPKQGTPEQTPALPGGAQEALRKVKRLNKVTPNRAGPHLSKETAKKARRGAKRP